MQKDSGYQTTLLISSFWTLREQLEKHLTASSSSSLLPPRSPSLGCTRTLQVRRDMRDSLQPVTKFSPSAWPLHHPTRKAFGSHNQSLSIKSEITKWWYLLKVMIKGSCPSNTTPLHETFLPLQKESRIFSFTSPTQTLNLTLTYIPSFLMGSFLGIWKTLGYTQWCNDFNRQNRALFSQSLVAAEHLKKNVFKCLRICTPQRRQLCR